MTDKIILRELQFFSRHGLLPVEAENDQHFSVTMELELPLATAGHSDRLDDTVDYLAVQKIVRNVLEGPRKHLLETLAEVVAAEILRGFPRIDAVSVEVTKSRPPVDFKFAGVSVKIRRDRGRLPP